MGMNFLRKGISFGSMVYKAERAEMKKMQEFDKRVMVLQPYYDIINNFFAEITKQAARKNRRKKKKAQLGMRRLSTIKSSKMGSTRSRKRESVYSSNSSLRTDSWRSRDNS